MATRKKLADAEGNFVLGLQETARHLCNPRVVWVPTATYRTIADLRIKGKGTIIRLLEEVCTYLQQNRKYISKHDSMNLQAKLLTSELSSFAVKTYLIMHFRFEVVTATLSKMAVF